MIDMKGVSGLIFANNRVKMRNAYLVACCVFCFLFMFFTVEPYCGARTLTDISGKKVIVPDRIRSAWGASPPATYLLYSIDPSVIAGLSTPLREWEKTHMRKEMQKLPVLGGWYGQGNVPSMEMVLKVKPELIVVPSLSTAMDLRMAQGLQNVPIPAIRVNVAKLSNYPDAFLTLGEALGRRARGRELSEYARKTLADAAEVVKKIPDGKKMQVYYAEGVDGLSTECHVSMHTELIELAGGRNVHRCSNRTVYGMEKVSLEQVLMYDPDVILVFERDFFKSVFTDARWRQIKAVKNGRVYLIPRQPFNWFDRPPSFMRLLGIKWLLNLLHPDMYHVDIVTETQRFFSLFLDVRLDRKEASKLIYE